MRPIGLLFKMAQPLTPCCAQSPFGILPPTGIRIYPTNKRGVAFITWIHPWIRQWFGTLYVSNHHLRHVKSCFEAWKLWPYPTFVTPTATERLENIVQNVKKVLPAFIITLALISTSCRTLTSTTYIKPNDSFILGNNEHGTFSVKLKNASSTNLELWKAPITGGRHSPVTVKPNETLKISVDKNTALRIENKANEQATVELLVKGDTGLSMGYKN